MAKSSIQKIVSGVNILVRIYVVVTLGLLLLFAHQKWLVDFGDLVKYTPTVFVQDVYTDPKYLDFYSFMGTEYDSTPISITDALFCKNENNLWERVKLPPTKNFTLKVDDRRNMLLDKLSNSIDSDNLMPDVADTVNKVRDFGIMLASEDGFAINYDVSDVFFERSTQCRMKLYYETKTRFFNLDKSVNFFSHTIQVNVAQKFQNP